MVSEGHRKVIHSAKMKQFSSAFGEWLGNYANWPNCSGSSKTQEETVSTRRQEGLLNDAD